MRFRNPVIPGFHPDPSICRVGEDYYLVTSSFEYFPGVPVFHSLDLIHWRQIGHCLTRPSQLPLEGTQSSHGIYAPTIRFHNGRFYMVTTNVGMVSSDVARGGNFYVWTEDPAGAWSEPVWVDQEGIDPSLLFDDDGTVYLTSSENRQSVIDIATGKRLSDVRRSWPGTGGSYLEAPHLYKINGLYYLMAAEGGTGRGHMVTIARSQAPWGPFEPCPYNPILSNRALAAGQLQATGHGDLVQAQDGSWWIVFLAIREIPGLFPRVHILGRETCLAPVSWTQDGWPVVNGTGTAGLEVEADCLPQHPWEAGPDYDNFDEPALRPCWNFLRNPRPEDWSLADRKGWLRLTGSAVTLNDVGSPAFVGRRQQHWNCRACALVEFEPQREGEEAGLSVFMNERHHYEIAVTRQDGRRCIIVRRRVGALSDVAARFTVHPGLLELGVRADQHRYRFTWAHLDHRPSVIAEGETRYLSTETAGGFTGVYFGLHATGNGGRCATPAYFDWFRYRPVER